MGVPREVGAVCSNGAKLRGTCWQHKKNLELKVAKRKLCIDTVCNLFLSFQTSAVEPLQPICSGAEGRSTARAWR